VLGVILCTLLFTSSKDPSTAGTKWKRLISFWIKDPFGNFWNRTELTVWTKDKKIALYVWIEICMTRIVRMQNKLLDFMSLQIQHSYNRTSECTGYHA
jgi:hypothetical protein